MTYTPKKTIVLVGLMGVGKTTLGKRLAGDMGLEFVDLDILIEQDQGCSISQIFDYASETTFRSIERRILQEQLQSGVKIIATGGGAFIEEENRKMIKEKAISIWLKADLGTLIDRTSKRTNRPLLEQGNKKHILTQLMEKRDPIYEEADFSVQTDRGSHYTIIREIIKKIKLYDK